MSYVQPTTEELYRPRLFGKRGHVRIKVKLKCLKRKGYLATGFYWTDERGWQYW